MQLAQRNPHPNLLRTRAARPAYLDYPYTSPEPTFTFWDDYKHQIWWSIIGAILIASTVVLFQSWTTCACAGENFADSAETIALT